MAKAKIGREDKVFLWNNDIFLPLFSIFLQLFRILDRYANSFNSRSNALARNNEPTNK